MASFNKVILMGNLTRDPELRQSQSGTHIAKTGLAINDRVPDGQGGYREETSFIDIVVFGRQAENFGRFFHKGRPCLLEGKLRQGRWEDKETGQARSKVEVIVDRWHFVGGREGAEGGEPRRQSGSAQADPPAREDASFPTADEFQVPDDVPF